MDSDVLLFLGAGASAPYPSLAPTFDVLMNSVLENLGWKHQTDGRAKSHWQHTGYPDINPPWESGIPPEVVFRVLDQFHIGFSEPVETRMKLVKPNAVHQVAANLLAKNGIVWTTNIDTAIEKACSVSDDEESETVKRSLGLLMDVPGSEFKERDFSDATFGWLIKFHGSADVPGSLAFTDYELLSPLPQSQVDRLVAGVRDRHILLYGYRGADPDLHDLLTEAFKVSASTTWFVISQDQRRTIQQFFPEAKIEFKPKKLEREPHINLAQCAQDFIEIVTASGLTEDIDGQILEELGKNSRKFQITKPDFDFHPPAIVHAELVERFGDPRESRKAFRAAMFYDLRHPSKVAIRVVPKYFSWCLRWSLYHGGLVSKIMRIATKLLRTTWIQALLNQRPLAPARDLILDKGTALLLSDGKWHDLLKLTEFSTSVRDTTSGQPWPPDLYYRGHARRYAGEIKLARDDQRRAESGLSGSNWRRADPERLAGSILENGILDIYVGSFASAVSRGDDLKDFRGRFAIQRWKSWGHWLSGTARLYLLQIDEAKEELEAARKLFAAVGEEKHVNDVLSAQLLSSRLAIALDLDTKEFQLPKSSDLTARQRDDFNLVRADIALAKGDIQLAKNLLGSTIAAPSNTPARLWAQLVEAQINLIEKGVFNEFETLRFEAQRRGARWLEYQANAGLARAGVESAKEQLQYLSAQMQFPSDIEKFEQIHRGSRPVLWALT
jgi:hypothetical protein